MFKTYKIDSNTWTVTCPQMPSLAPFEPEFLTFADEENANDTRDFLNAVFAAGARSVQIPILAALNLPQAD